MNQACIMNLGRMLLNGDEDLWCELLRKKYKIETMDGMLRVKNKDSNLWKAIVNVQDKLMEVSCWSIGDGNGIKFCNDNWIVKGTKPHDCNVIIPVHLKEARVRDLVGKMVIGIGISLSGCLQI